jgi:hypothetical protein
MKIRLQSDKRAELILDLTRGPATIGRSKPDNTFAIEHGEVSKAHAQLLLKNGKTVIEDLGSTNGVYVSGKRIKEPTVIQPAIPFRLGHSGPRIWFDLIDANAPAAASNDPTAEAPAVDKKADKLPAPPSDPSVVIKIPTGVYESPPEKPAAPTEQSAMMTMQVQAAPSAAELKQEDTQTEVPPQPDENTQSPTAAAADSPPSPLRMLLPIILMGALIGAILISMKMLEQDNAGEIEELQPGDSRVDFAESIAPILQNRCVKCHGPDKQKGKLRLDSRGTTLAGSRNGRVITRGSAVESPLYQRVILNAGSDDIMPQEGKPLTQAQTDLIRRWINQGAMWPDSHRSL